jgi:hypothetical protein
LGTTLPKELAFWSGGPDQVAGCWSMLVFVCMYVHAAIEHGRAERVDVAMERVLDSSELCFHVTEHRGAGMSPKECELAIRFGMHAAKVDAEALRNYSHNGIGTKACLNIFSRLAIFSISPVLNEGLHTYCLLLLDVHSNNGSGTCKPATRLVWKSDHGVPPDWAGPDGPHDSIIRDTCAQVSHVPQCDSALTLSLTHRLAATCSLHF